MPDFEPKQLFVVYEEQWKQLEKLAARNGCALFRLPDGTDDEGRPIFKDPAVDDITPTYGFMPLDVR